MYWQIGRRILDEEQKGKERADYGAYLLKKLAKKLEPEFGSGFSVRQLEMCRQFYRVYPRSCVNIHFSSADDADNTDFSCLYYTERLLFICVIRVICG